MGTGPDPTLLANIMDLGLRGVHTLITGLFELILSQNQKGLCDI